MYIRTPADLTLTVMFGEVKAESEEGGRGSFSSQAIFCDWYVVQEFLGGILAGGEKKVYSPPLLS